MAHGAVIGIDLGTTYSLAAMLRNGVPEVLPNALGEQLTPSAVSVAEDGSVLIGPPARARAVTHPEHTALAFKRDMGSDRVFELGARRFRPEELSALVLQLVRQDAEAYLQAPIEEAVVTVPAYFGELQRRATRDACELAGLPVERIINEPTAAALAYGLHERHRELRAVVLDLGGGTFDVTVLEIMEGVIEIQASAGDSKLGGEDFLDMLVDEALSQIQSAHGYDAANNPRDLARVREAAEHAKKRLSSNERGALALTGFGPKPGADVELWLERDAVEKLWEPLLQRIRTPIQRALRDARVSADRIDEVLMVGGATRMPCVQRLAAQLFGRLPLRTLPPDEAVALGAAVQAALKSGDTAVSDMVVTDVAPFTLGIAVAEKIGTHQVTGMFAPIIERGTVLPASRVKTFSTIADGQRELNIEVFQGEHSLCKENQRLGQYMVKGIPPKPAGEESLEVRFSYDLNGILEVDTTVSSTNKTQSLLIERAPGKLDKKQVAEIRKRLSQLKFHPREALPNVTALSRAEALYVELTGSERELLGAAIARLRTALESQDASLIEQTRQSLLSLLAQRRRG